MADDPLVQIERQNRRLQAAFDRMERLVDAAHALAADDGRSPLAVSPTAEPEAEAILRENQRLRAANAELCASLRALTDAAADPGAGAIEQALRAEVEALRAERAAEVAELDSILAELRPLIAGGADHARA